MAPVAAVHHLDFTAEGLASAKAGRRVSVCLPARDEAGTVGDIVGAIRAELVHRHALVDEVVVIDDGSTDATTTVARRAGARVVRTARTGKGRAMWTGLVACDGDLVAFCDADVRDFDPRFVVGLLGPLLEDDGVSFVKGFYDRPMAGQPGQGGRVTELMAKPLLRSLFPALGAIYQPLAGECAGRREVLEQLPFAEGYGVDIGLVVDVALRFGLSAMAQVDLGERRHRNRPLEELAPQADAVLGVVLARAGLGPPVPECPPLAGGSAHRRRTA